MGADFGYTTDYEMFLCSFYFFNKLVLLVL